MYDGTAIILLFTWVLVLYLVTRPRDPHDEGPDRR